MTEKNQPLWEGEAQQLAELFKIFGDPTRIKLLFELLSSESCVGDLALALDMSQSAVSHQLRIIKESRLVKCRREGKNMIYSLADDHVRTILSQGREHIEERWENPLFTVRSREKISWRKKLKSIDSDKKRKWQKTVIFLFLYA